MFKCVEQVVDFHTACDNAVSMDVLRAERGCLIFSFIASYIEQKSIGIVKSH